MKAKKYLEWLWKQYGEFIYLTLPPLLVGLFFFIILLQIYNFITYYAFLTVDNIIAISVPALSIALGLFGFLAKKAFDEYLYKDEVKKSLIVEIKTNIEKLFSASVERAYTNEIYNQITLNTKFVKGDLEYDNLQSFYTYLDYLNTLILNNKDYALLQEKSLEILLGFIKFNIKIETTLVINISRILEIYQKYLADTDFWPSTSYKDYTHDINSLIIETLPEITGMEKVSPYFPTERDHTDQDLPMEVLNWKNTMFPMLKAKLEKELREEIKEKLKIFINKLVY